MHNGGMGEAGGGDHDDAGGAAEAGAGAVGVEGEGDVAVGLVAADEGGELGGVIDAAVEGQVAACDVGVVVEDIVDLGGEGGLGAAVDGL